ncbi:ATP11-domain-containing protein [Lichtheimia hyalospora FSU 10163]|nr:ATP11-domain-containing protein [Lichtheimia hyalospora FSU 10163]
MFLPLLSKRCASAARSAYINRNVVFRQTRQAEVVSVPSSVFFGHGRLARVRQIATEANRVKVDYDAKYAEKLKKMADAKGVSVDELKTKAKENVKQAQNALKSSAEAPKVKPTPTTTTTTTAAAKPKAAASPEAVAARSKMPYESSAPTLDKVVKLELLEKEDAETVTKIWTEYHADKDCITAVIPQETYDIIQKRSQQYPLFVVPMPRESGVEFFFMQFNFTQVYFTSLLEYKAKGAEARPFLTITHYPELADSKGIVLMKGEISDNPRMIDTQNAQFLAFVLQQFYATGGEEKFKLVEKFHKEPQNFDYQELINEIERVV